MRKRTRYFLFIFSGILFFAQTLRADDRSQTNWNPSSQALGAIARCETFIRALQGVTSWKAMDRDIISFNRRAAMQNRLGFARMLRFAPPSLLQYYRSIGYRWSMSGASVPSFHFEGLEYAGARLNKLRKEAAKRTGISLDQMLRPKMIFEDLYRPGLRRVSLGENLPSHYFASEPALADGKTFYRYLAERIFPIAAPSEESILNDSFRYIPPDFTTDHDFAHFYGPFVVRPQMNEALIEVGRAVVQLQHAVEDLSKLKNQKPELFTARDERLLNKIKKDIEDPENGIPFLSYRLFMANESAYFISDTLALSSLSDFMAHEADRDSVEIQLKTLTAREWRQFFNRLTKILSNAALPIGGAAADLRFILYHQEEVRHPEIPYTDLGFMTLLAKTQNYFELKDSNFEKAEVRNQMASDIANLMTYLKMARNLAPEEWMRETVTEPVRQQTRSIRKEIHRLTNAQNAKGILSFHPEVLDLPPVNPQSRIGYFIDMAPWDNPNMIRSLFGISDR